jgi:hypothetical protein
LLPANQFEKHLPSMQREAAVEASVVSGAVASVALAEAWGNLFPVMAASGAALNA